MSDYVKSTDFASKDTLPSGDSAKIVRGTEIDAEFEALEVAIASKANTSDVSSTYAPLNSPTFTGSPVLPTGTTAVTQTAGDNDTSVATTAFVTTAVAALGYPSFKNRIINGDMRIDQRNAGASVTPTNGQYTLDRWSGNVTAASKFTAQQNAGSVTPPAGFVNYLGVTSSSAYSVGAGDAFSVYQAIEGLNLADLAWGTADASSVTLSFWVRSSLTGTFGGSLRNSAVNRSYPFSYTISSANTWEQKTVTIAGDTSGTWLKTNGIGILLTFGLGVGSTYSGTAGSWDGSNYVSSTGATSVVGTNGATFYITGVQLEKGSTATSFDYRPYGTELALCQRYCINYNSANANGAFYRYCYGECTTTVGFQAQIQLPVTMRTTPSVTTTGTAANYAVYSRATVTALNAAPTIGGTDCSPQTVMMNTTVASGLTAGSAGALMSNNNQTSYLLFSAEL